MYTSTLLVGLATLTAVNGIVIPKPKPNVIDTIADVIPREPETQKMHLEVLPREPEPVKLDIGVPPLPRFNRRRASRRADDIASSLLARQDANATATASNSTADAAAAAAGGNDKGLDIGGLINGDLSSLGNVDVGGLINTLSGLFDGKGNVADEISQGASQLLGSNAGDLVSDISGLFNGSFDPSKLLNVGGDVAGVVGDALGKSARSLETRQAAAAANATAGSNGQLDLGGLLKGDLSSLGNVDVGSLLSTITGLFDGQGDVTDEISQEATKLLGSSAGDLVSTIGSVVNGSADASALLGAGGDVASLVSGALRRSLYVRQDANSTESAANATAAAGAAAAGNSTASSSDGELDIGGLLKGDLSSLQNVDVGSLLSTLTGLFDGKGDAVDEASQAATQLLGADAGSIVQSVGDVISGGADASSLLNLGGDVASLVGGLFGGDAKAPASAAAAASASSTASADAAATSA